MFNSVAYAQEAANPIQGAMGGITAFLPFILIFVVFYFLMIRPQQKRQRQLMDTLNSLKAGDQVNTTGGIIATIDSIVDNNTFMLNIGGGVKVQILRSGISGRYEPVRPSMNEKK